MIINKKRRVYAEDEIETVETPVEEECCSDVLFEASDVGELIEEITGEEVEVAVDEDNGDVIIQVGEDEYTITPDEDLQEVYDVEPAPVEESTRRPLAGKKHVKASANRRGMARRPVAASKKPAATRNTRTIKKISK